MIMFGAAGDVFAPFYRALRRLKNRVLNLVDPPLVVLAYHRVTQLSTDPHQIVVTPDNFRAQMHYLREHCRCVRLDEDWREVRGPAVAVTFDDGYADNLYHALPILEEAEVPATFFICTGNLGSRNEFWSDELEWLILGAGNGSSRFTLDDREHGGSWLAANGAERQILHDQLQKLMLTIDATRREGWFEQLRRWKGEGRSTRENYRSLDHEELRTLAGSPWVTIGAHGVTHTPLAVLAEAEQRREIVASKHQLVELVGREIATFAYPFGGHRQFNATTRRLCRETGLRKAVTTLPGQVHRWTDPLQLPRQLVRNWDAATFAARLEGFWT